MKEQLNFQQSYKSAGPAKKGQETELHYDVMFMNKMGSQNRPSCQDPLLQGH